MTIDGFRPDGPHGEVVLSGLGRDLLTDADGVETVEASQRLDLRADFIADQGVHGISAEPGEPALADLIGVGSRSGFRRTVGQLLPARLGDGSLLSLMLDEIPIVTSLSRLALLHSDAIDMTPGSDDPANRRSGRVDICAGWEAGSSMSQRIAIGRRPLLTPGTPSPPLDVATDPLAWHETAPLPPLGFRRRRRIDVAILDDDRRVVIDSIFRDVYVTAELVERIVHEYTVTAVVDRVTGRFMECSAQADVLPAPECNRAEASARRLIGLTADEVLDYIRSDMHGITTCTHLNDHLRALGDVHALMALLR